MTRKTLAVLGLGLALTSSAYAQDTAADKAKEARENAAKQGREARSKIAEAMEKAGKAKADAKEAREDAKEARKDAKEAREDAREARKEAHAAVRATWAELKASRQTRRTERREALKEQWGDDVLKRPAAQAELKVHARRLARLYRMRTLAKEANKDAVVTQVDKLIEREKTRHNKRMDTIKTPEAAQ